MSTFEPEVIVGSGLAGLVATHELTLAGKRHLVLDQESRANLGGHGYNALEGTFLGGCIFSGRAAGRALARDLA